VSEEDYTKKLSEFKAAKSAPTVMIMACDDSNYKNLVDVLDEMNICNIARYAIVNITPYDLGLIDKKTPPAK
jgi:biopolymer transport protein ExbD